MTLKNRDGSPFKLSGPNPAMKDQKMWGDFVTHNMEWKPEFSKDNTVLKPLESDFFVKESFLDALNAAKEDIQIVETKEEIKLEIHKPVIRRDPENDPTPKDSLEKSFIYCLPAQILERKDALYGDVYKTVKYGTPTSFEAVILSQNDFLFEIWTDAQISVGSVLYPKNGSKRWWRVKEKTEKGNGWILSSMFSDYQPSFDL